MKFAQTELVGVFIVEAEIASDDRGYLARIFCAEEFRRHGIIFETVQCNVSLNRKTGTLRGLHYQGEPAAEAKLVRCTRGRVFDVAVDLRTDSPSYCRWVGVELSQDSLKALFIPEGCAHGFLTLEDDTELFYHMGAAYVPELSRGVRWNDPVFGINWPVEPTVISERDAGFPFVEAAPHDC